MEPEHPPCGALELVALLPPVVFLLSLATLLSSFSLSLTIISAVHHNRQRLDMEDPRVGDVSLQGQDASRTSVYDSFHQARVWLSTTSSGLTPAKAFLTASQHDGMLPKKLGHLLRILES